MRRFLVLSLILPTVLEFLGALSNQLVLIANHGAFPVMATLRWLGDAPDANGMLDDIHCVMTSATHLNFLADVFNFHSAILSIGDLSLGLGTYLEPYCYGFALISVFYLLLFEAA